MGMGRYTNDTAMVSFPSSAACKPVAINRVDRGYIRRGAKNRMPERLAMGLPA
jgi:hypothetical protein